VASPSAAIAILIFFMVPPAADERPLQRPSQPGMGGEFKGADVSLEYSLLVSKPFLICKKL
jgi:hypothetical protein